VSLDTLQSRQRQVELFERYEALLTDHQRQVLELYLRSDWSLSEIARIQDTSRQAVHDLIRRSAQALEEYEERLGLLAAEEARRVRQAALAGELAEIRRRLARLEEEIKSPPPDHSPVGARERL
jgi:predicted DNA-binding protein YlxM (UPF0122 family)